VADVRCVLSKAKDNTFTDGKLQVGILWSPTCQSTYQLTAYHLHQLTFLYSFYTEWKKIPSAFWRWFREGGEIGFFV